MDSVIGLKYRYKLTQNFEIMYFSDPPYRLNILPLFDYLD
jgi:hypothetical protein